MPKSPVKACKKQTERNAEEHANKWAIISFSNMGAPAGLADAKASIAAACSQGNPCAEVNGQNATEPADRQAWINIVNATGGTDQSGGGNYMCVGTQNCWFVHRCYTCDEHTPVLTNRNENLAPTGRITVEGKGTLYFYNDNLRGWCNREDYNSGCRDNENE